jgi:hypothetical protein
VFDPAEFIALASRLASDPEASRVRAAYGRAYYGLYLSVRRAIADRHRIHHRRLNHGALYSHLQSPRATTEVRRLGRELERLYTLRQKADYDLSPGEPWRGHLEDHRLAATLAARALTLSRALPRLDFSSVIPLF